MKPQVMIEWEQNQRLVDLVRRIDGYLLQDQHQDLFGTSAGSSDRSLSEVQKKLGNGLRLRAELGNDKQTTILQIFLDPLRFWNWTKTLGSLEFFYMDPFGIEVYYKEGKWGISIDKVEIPWKNTDSIHEIACIEVQRIGKKRKLVRTA